MSKGIRRQIKNLSIAKNRNEEIYIHEKQKMYIICYISKHSIYIVNAMLCNSCNHIQGKRYENYLQTNYIFIKSISELEKDLRKALKKE